MDRGIAFTEVRPPEAERVESLAKEIWPKVYADMIGSDQIEYMLRRMYDPEIIRREIVEKEIRYLWIHCDGEPVGFAAFGPLRESEPCFLHKIYIKPEMQGQGIGTRALGEVESQIREGCGTGLELRVNRHNEKAIRFYRRNGLKIVKEDCAGIGGGFVMDDYIFQKELGS